MTKRRISTFFGNGMVGHVTFADPVCNDLHNIIYQAGLDAGATMHRGGVYLCIEGPQFSTRAESLTYRKWGVDVIGMTNVTEAKLAREAEICYATIALATDYDCWHSSEQSVDIQMILKTFKKNAENVVKLFLKTIPKIKDNPECNCKTDIKNAIIC